MRASTPATCGDAILVPSFSLQRLSSYKKFPDAARIETPGAAIFGFGAPSMRGPLLEVEVMLPPDSLYDETAIAKSAVPGELIVYKFEI
jgi:hypothetical protein